jgi:leucyl aminopeptidase (aminopeptidase T)
MPELMATDLAELAIKSKDLVEVMEFTDRLASAVSEANKVHISNRIGTDVVFDITGRRGLSLTPVFRTPGQLSVIPFYAEVACAVVEGKGSGTAVLDGTVVGLPSLNGVLNEPISWGVQKGSVVGINGGREAVKLRGLLEKLDDNAWKIGELGIGTNFKLPNRLRGTRVDNAIFGHIHLALGRNVDLGGEQWSQIHADFLCSDVKVELDGRTIIEDGRFIG